MSYYTLSDELINRNIDFMDGFGEIVFTYNNNITTTGAGDITNWEEIKIKKINKNNKYYKVADIENGIYKGNFADGLYYDMMAELFMIKIKHGFMKTLTKKYILMIIDNPLYDEESVNQINKGRYKLLIFTIVRYSTYHMRLNFNDIFTSTI